MTLQIKPLAELTEEAIQILYRELGTVNTIRFLRQFSTSLGNYTTARAEHEDEETLDELLDEIRQRRVKQASSYQERIDKIRRHHPRAYEKWTEEEDAQLQQEYRAGRKVQKLAELLGRQPSAIEIRLRKLGLMT